MALRVAMWFHIVVASIVLERCNREGQLAMTGLIAFQS